MRLALTTLFVSVMVAGCEDAASIHPFYTAADVTRAVADSRIEGAWISPDPDSTGIDRVPAAQWTITRAPDGSGPYVVEARARTHDRERAQAFKVRLISDRGRLFFDAEFQSAQEGAMPPVRPIPPLLVAGHVIGRVWIADDFLRVSLLMAPWFKEHAPEGSWLKLEDGSESHLLITESTEELRRLLLAQANDPGTFAEAIFFCRPGTDCKVRMAEEFAQRQAVDEDTLEFAAGVYSERGDRTRAIPIRQRLTELNPRSVRYQLRLGEEYLFARRFAEARRAFGRAETLEIQSSADPKDVARILENVHRQVVWSYFLDGQYADVVKIVRAHTARAPNAAAAPILLAYVSLLRLGQSGPAAELLRDQSNRFVGPGSEHELLLRAIGRVPELPGGTEPVQEQRRRMRFFDALQRIAAGDSLAGRRILEVVAKAEFDEYVLAAGVELERLDRAR